MNRLKTDFLWVRSSFLAGAGSVLDLNGHLYDYNVSEEPDEIAIAHDWKMIGQDLRDALEKADAEMNAKPDPMRKTHEMACG